MASTYSPTLRIELIGDGDQSGIWGQTTNNNLGSLLEQSITGVVTILMTDTNYTLTSYNGVVDEARNAVIVATGTNSAQRNIVAPLVEKTYTIKNSTTGGYAVQIIGSTGTGVVIPNGATASVYCDGTNFYPLQVNTVGNQTINGNLLVTGTTTLQGALSGTTATFSGAISSVSPTFTGVPVAPTAAAGTSTTQIATTAFVANTVTGLGLGTMSTQNANNVNISGGAINGTTVGSTTRAAGAFTTLALSTALPVTSGGTGTTTSTGSGSVVLNTSPTLVSPALGTPSSGSLSSCTGLPIDGGTTGTLPVIRGGTGSTTASGARSNLGLVIGSDVPSPTGTGASGTWGIAVSGGVTGGNVACNGIQVTSAAPTIWMYDSDESDFAMHVNSGLWYVLNQGGSGIVSVNQSGDMAAASYSGAGTGLTGTASGLSIGGNAATATTANYANSAGTAGYITNSSYNGYGLRTVSTSAPSGGSNGDIWYRV